MKNKLKGVYILEDKSKSIIKDGQEYMFCKIGMSETDLNKRIKQVQANYKVAGNKSNLTTYITMESNNPSKLEKWYHVCLKSFNVTNEFYLVPIDKLNEVIMKLQIENIKIK